MPSTFTPASVVPGTLLPASTVVVYTVPVLTSLKISQFTLTNNDPSISHKVLVYLASNAALPAAKDLLATVILAPNQAVQIYQASNHVIAAGGSIQCQADADSLVTVKVSGTLIS